MPLLGECLWLQGVAMVLIGCGLLLRPALLLAAAAPLTSGTLGCRNCPQAFGRC